MKKVILTGAAMMAFAAASFAQNSATLNQVGNTQSGNATQSGNNNTSNIQQTTASGITNTGNYANTTQASGYLPANGNTANINQLGTKSGFATTFQEGGSVSSGNTSTINQKNNNGGTGVLSLPANPANAAGDQGAVVAQGGNYANTYQQGYNETVTVNQNDNSKSNIATSRQDNFGTGQSVTINQNGGALGASSNNKATANQFGDNNNLSISQSNNSDNNKADVRQGYSLAAGGPNAFNATATVEQNGGAAGASKNNEATILQIYSGANNATVLQNDDSELNKASVTQSGSVGSTANVSQSLHSSGNQTTVSQSASGGHTATVNQNGNSAGWISKNNEALVTQTGSANQATVNQLGEDTNGGGLGNAENNKATVTQSGTNDVASIVQKDNALFNKATINQTGSSASADVATIEQLTQAGNNEATVNQNGTAAGNTAFISQRQSGFSASLGLVAGSKATIDQNTTAAGGGNLSEIYQGRSVASDAITAITALGTSYNNTATSSQQGSNNTSRLYQVGHDLKATLEQTGDANIIQGTGLANFPAYATQYGDNNTLTVKQTSGVGGPGNTANVFQSGSGNTGNITQSTN